MADKKKKDDPISISYTALDRKGVKVSGEITAATLEAGKKVLETQGFTQVKVKKKSFSIFGDVRPIKDEDITSLCRQMATMLMAGIPAVQALTIIGDGLQDGALKQLCQKICFDIETGGSFSAAVKKHPGYFDNLVCSLVESGELSGTLDVMMDRIAFYKEKSDSLRRKIKKALYYPAAVVLVAGIVTTVLLIKVVPTFKELFDSYGAELPAFTTFVLGISSILQDYGLYMIGGLIILSVVLTRTYRTTPSFRHLIEKLILKLPVFGTILKKAIIARFSRTLSTTTEAGVPLTDALEAVSIASNNIVYYTAIQDIKNGLATGQQLRQAIKKTGVFPPLVVQMVGIGEESGALEGMLGKLATIYEEEVDMAVDGLSTLLEPMIMLVLGVVVGGLVVAMYMPIFKMGSIM